MANDRHHFHISVEVQTTEADWPSEPYTLTVRAYSLREALRLALAEPLSVWGLADEADDFYEDDEPIEKVKAAFDAGVKTATAPAGRFRVDMAASPVYGIEMQGPFHISTHPPEKCAGRACVIHAPSEHHMRDWPLNWRADRYLMERMCEHGVGHPDPDDVAYQKIARPEAAAGMHSCDLCCIPPK